MLDVYQNIKDRRKELGMTQQELAFKVGYSDRSTIAKIEAGKIDIPQSTIVALAKALECTPSYLMGWEYDYVFNDKNDNSYTIETAYKRLTPGNKKLVDGLIESLLSMQQ